MSPKAVKVDEDDLRRLINENGYWEAAKKHRLSQVVVDSNHPAPDRSNQPHCTRSQEISYRDERGDEVALVHQYLLRDGTIGASGQPDPKRVFHEGVLYYVDRVRK